MSVRKFSIKQNGADAGSSGPEEVVSPFDALGMPHVMITNQESWVYILASLAGLVPGKEVEVGSGFDLKWESRDKTLSATGKGKAVGLVDDDRIRA